MKNDPSHDVQDVCAGPAHWRHPPGHVQEAGAGTQGGQGLLQARHHLQHGRVRRHPRGSPRELPPVSECRNMS